MRPFVWVRYESSDAWMWRRGRTAAAECGPQLENVTSAPAYDIDLSDLVLDDETRYRFERVESLQPGEARPLDSLLQPRAAPLTQIISRHIVARALAGRPPVSGWPVRIAYRSRHGRKYETRCEIRITRLPLGIASVIVANSDAAGRSE
jgi:hypothetical protein